MPIDLYRNSGIYNMIAEGEIADILSNFNSAYVMDVIDSNLRNRFAYNPTLSNPNIVNSYELNFKGMLANFPTDADNIMSIRQETYLDIINKICNAFNMQYIGDEPDCYTLAYNVYDLFVSGYARNIINFSQDISIVIVLRYIIIWASKNIKRIKIVQPAILEKHMVM